MPPLRLGPRGGIAVKRSCTGAPVFTSVYWSFATAQRHSRPGPAAIRLLQSALAPLALQLSGCPPEPPHDFCREEPCSPLLDGRSARPTCAENCCSRSASSCCFA